MSIRKISTRALVRIASFTAAALTALALFSAVCWNHLTAYRRQTAVDADRAFEETVGALSDLSESLEKSRYAGDGAMCAKICAEIYADAGRAGTALSALPFSTVEMEEIKRFISLSGDYAFTLCREAAELGFSEEQRDNLTALSAMAEELAASLRGMHSELRDGVLTMDRREKQAANILDGLPSFLGERLGDYARDFPAARPITYHGQFSAQEKEQTEAADEAAAREQAAALLGCEPEEMEVAARFEAQERLLLALDGKTVAVTAAGIESLRDSRLVSESRIGEEEARADAEEALRSLGYGDLHWEESALRGNVLELRASAEADGVAGLDHEIAVSIALDDGSLYALDLSGAAGESAASEWPLSEAEAEAAVPAGLRLQSMRRVSMAGADGQSIACYELQCMSDEGKNVLIYLNADSGKQEDIVIG